MPSPATLAKDASPAAKDAAPAAAPETPRPDQAIEGPEQPSSAQLGEQAIPSRLADEPSPTREDEDTVHARQAPLQPSAPKPGESEQDLAPSSGNEPSRLPDHLLPTARPATLDEKGRHLLAEPPGPAPTGAELPAEPNPPQPELSSSAPMADQADGNPPTEAAYKLAQRIDKARRVLSICSQAIIRAYEDDALHAEVCRQLVTVGGYRTAWIGVAEAGQLQSLRPVAHACSEPRLWETLQEMWSRDTQHRSATNRAWREQRPRVARDILIDPRMRRLRLDAVRGGYGATCALPLQFGPNGSGVLTLFAEDPAAFDPEEVAILRELAGDLSAGVSGLRDRAVREQLEEELDEAETRYRSLIENSPEGIFRCDRHGKLLFANQSLATLLGYDTPAALLLDPPGTLAAHLASNNETEFRAALLRGRLPRPVEEEMLRQDGSKVWVNLILLAVRTAEGEAIEGFVQDMTARRTARTASERLAAVVMSTTDAIYSHDMDEVVLSWNHGAEQMYGYSASEAIGKPIRALIIPGDREREFAAIMTAIKAGQAVPHLETQRRRKDGTVIDVSLSVAPLVEGDILVGGSIVAREITQRKRAESARHAIEQQEAEVEHLSAVNKVRLDFISQASHELNTPLTPIRTELEMLKEATLGPGEQRSVAVIERNILRMAGLVKDMLDSSRVESGNLRMEPTRNDLRAVVTQSVESFLPQAVTSGITLSAQAGAPVEAEFDPARITQVMLNLLSNALKFTPQGGHIESGVRTSATEVVAWVKDDGLGVPRDQAARLFQPFSRLQNDVPGAPKGTGLGLFISKGIVDQHGGRIWVDSPGIGLGSTWNFSLPLTTKNVEAKRGPPGTSPVGAPRTPDPRRDRPQRPGVTSTSESLGPAREAKSASETARLPASE